MTDTSTVTCTTPGCANEGIPLELALTYPDPETGETRTVDTVICGVCGNEIPDALPAG